MSNDFSNLNQLQHSIPLDKAKEMTRAYRDNKEKILKPEFSSKDILPICETFNKDALAPLMSNPNCLGIRIYYGMDTDKKIHAIIVGVNSTGADMLATAPAGSSTLSPTFDPPPTENGQRCPPICPPGSPLNEP